MPATAKILVITDMHGRILAADLSNPAASPRRKDNEPQMRLMPREGQRALMIEVPKEVLELSGLYLSRYFSEVSISWPSEVKLPKVKVVKKHKD